MVEQIQKQGRKFVQSQKNKQTLSLLPRMAHLALVLTLGTCIMSCSQVRVNLVYECSNQSDRGWKSDRDDIHTTLLDITDDFTYKDRNNFTLNHFLERKNNKKEEQFEYQIERIRI